jgi:general secretion pathway protein E
MEEPYVEVHDSGQVRQLPIGLDPLTVGRHRDNRLVLGDTMASRFHCLISKSKKGYILRDLNSSNGTLLNGNVTKLTQLINGDEVRIGEATLVFRAPNGVADGPRDNSDLTDEIRRHSKTVPLEMGPAPDVQMPQPPKTVYRPPVREHIGLEALGLQPSRTPPPAAEDFFGYEVREVDLDAVSDIEHVPEEEVAEALTDDMILEDEEGAIPLDDGPTGSNGSARQAPPRMESVPEPDDQPDLIDDVASVSPGRDSEQAIEQMVQSLPDRSFSEADIALIGARGQLVHPAGSGPRAGKREAVDWLRLLLLLSARGRATDIHLEPKGQEYVLRVRIDAAMVEVCRVSNTLGLKLSALVKVLSEIDMTQKSTIQEGHFSSRVPAGRRREMRRIDYRISFAPSVFGQKLVIRVLDASYAPLSLGALQMPEWMRQETERVIRQDSGMCLVCGPTGSGKTTSLYALIRGSDVGRRNVVTIEDPVEIQIEGVTQIPVDEEQGKTFSNLLRSTLRQDPDVILIGEIRDAETARTSMQAAITGHLVFSTLHTQNTVGTVFRLLDLGAEPYLIAQALQLILAQRLVKELCPSCKFTVKPTQEQLARMGEFGKGLNHLYAPRGCGRCLGTGFFGRRAIFELLSVNDELRELISRNATASEMQAVVTKGRFQRLHESGFQLVAQGHVPFEEIDRAVGRER